MTTTSHKTAPRDEDDDMNFGFVSKRERKERSASTANAAPIAAGTVDVKKKKTAYEMERDAKAAAVLASLKPVLEQEPVVSTEGQREEGTAPAVMEQSHFSQAPWHDGRRGNRWQHHQQPQYPHPHQQPFYPRRRPVEETSGPPDPETRARINRFRNHNLTNNALQEVDITTKRVMQINVAPGTVTGNGSNSNPPYRSTNRFASHNGPHPRFDPSQSSPHMMGRGRGYGGGRGGGRGAYQQQRTGYAPGARGRGYGGDGSGYRSQMYGKRDRE